MSLISKEEKEECNICCGIKGNFIKCPYCYSEACLVCQEKFILDQPHPKCMRCSKEWTSNWVRETFPKKFINNEYKKHKQDLLFDIEKTLLPNQQNTAGKCLKLYKKKESTEKNLENWSEKLKKEKDNLKESYFIARNFVSMLNLEIKGIDRDIKMILEGLQDIKESKSEKNVFRRSCPVKECRGYFDDISWKCGLCENKICKDCLEVEVEEHKCDKEIIKNVKSLLKETKPCPKCTAPIFKAMGCNQMFCTLCHTAFDWTTGRIDSGPIHNPHYWEYLRETGRDLDEVRRRNGIRDPDNQCLTFEDLVHTNVGRSNFNGIFGLLTHLEREELPKYTVVNQEDGNKDLRIRFLCNQFSEKEFKSKLTTRWKKNCFKFEVYQIYEMFYQASKDLILNYFRTENKYLQDILLINEMNTLDLYKELRRLQIYTLKNIYRICDMYEFKKINLWIDVDSFFSIFIPKFKIKPEKIFKDSKINEYRKKYVDYDWNRDPSNFFFLAFRVLEDKEKQEYIGKSKLEQKKYDKSIIELKEFEETIK